MISESLVIWCVSVVLTKNEYRDGSVLQQIAQSMSWRSGVTEEAARGAAVTYGMEQNPGFSVVMVSAAKIEVPLSALANAGDEARRCK